MRDTRHFQVTRTYITSGCRDVDVNINYQILIDDNAVFLLS